MNSDELKKLLEDTKQQLKDKNYNKDSTRVSLEDQRDYLNRQIEYKGIETEPNIPYIELEEDD